MGRRNLDPEDIVRYEEDGPRVVLLDQRRLPDEEVELECRSVAEVVVAIRELAIRGAPAIGVADAATLRAVLLRATDDVVQNIRDEQADAAHNVDFATIGPKPDRLFAGTEKSLSLMLKPLDALARDRHVDALGGDCGR